MSRTIRILLAVLLAVAGAAIAVPASAATPCVTGWGSLAKATAALGGAPLVTTRTGGHTCWDRVVFELDGPAAGYSVSYVDAVVQDGSGAVLPVPGGARMQVALHHPAYDGQGSSTYSQAGGTVVGYTTLRSVVYGGSFEGYTTFGVGVRARLPFRVFTLTGPGGHSRIVVDVAHRWT